VKTDRRFSDQHTSNDGHLEFGFLPDIRSAAPTDRAVLITLPPEQLAAVNAALFDTALTLMTYGVRPACP
jgi:hypothetical protein